MKNKTIAVDLAKSVFEVGVSGQAGHVDACHRLSRNQFEAFLVTQEPANVVLEACGSAHYWGRWLTALGHDVKLLPPAYVRPYVLRDKTDRTDVKGWLEASRNSAIRPVPVKTVSQQGLTGLHRVRSAWQGTRTARINTIRGILREFGLTIPVGATHAVARARAYIEDAEIELPAAIRDVLHEMCAEVGELEDRIGGVERQLQALSRQTAPIEQLQTIPGIGLLTSTALVGFVGDMRRFSSSRQFASYLGLTPREHSSGLRRGLGRIGKRGDTYLRMLLIHGARSALRAAKSRAEPDRLQAWALEIEKRRGHNKAAVALANKMARLVWAVSTRGVSYQSQYVPA